MGESENLNWEVFRRRWSYLINSILELQTTGNEAMSQYGYRCLVSSISMAVIGMAPDDFDEAERLMIHQLLSQRSNRVYSPALAIAERLLQTSWKERFAERKQEAPYRPPLSSETFSVFGQRHLLAPPFISFLTSQSDRHEEANRTDQFQPPGPQ